jgi:hypothetical protein
MLIRRGTLSAINCRLPYLSGSSFGVLALVIAMASGLLASATWSAAPSAITSLEVVDRAHKADRLLLPRIERVDRELPVGCESVVSSFARSPLVHVARDCLS